jgi:amino acid permease
MEKTVMVTFTNQSKASTYLSLSKDLFESIMTVIKVIVGSGIISLPYTVSVMGWALSIILFSFIGIFYLTVRNRQSIYNRYSS